MRSRESILRTRRPQGLIAGGLVGDALLCRGRAFKPLQLLKASFTPLGGCEESGKGRLHSFDHQSGAIA